MPALSSKAVSVIVISAFATALGGLFTSRGVATCNPISLRFTSQCMSVLIGMVSDSLVATVQGIAAGKSAETYIGFESK